MKYKCHKCLNNADSFNSHIPKTAACGDSIHLYK